MKRKRTGNTWRFVAAFALSTVLILDGLVPAWSAAAGPDSFTDRSYQDAGYAGPYGLARFVSGNGAADLEGLLFDVLGEGKAVGAEVEQDIKKDAQDVSAALDRVAAQGQTQADSVELAVLETLGWDENTDMSQRLVGSWGNSADEEDNEHFWPELDGFEGEWVEHPEPETINEKESSDSTEGEWLEDSNSGDGSKEDDWGASDVEFDVNNTGSAGTDIEPDADDGGGSDMDSVRMPVWKAHSDTQAGESKRAITLNADSVNGTGFTDDNGVSDTGSADSGEGHDGDLNSGSDSGVDQGSGGTSSGDNGGSGDDQNPGGDSSGGSGNSEGGPGNPDQNGGDDGDDTEDGDNKDQDKDPDDEDDNEGTDPGDEPDGDGEENDGEEEGASDDEEQEQEDPVQEEPALYISREGVWDGSIAESFAGGTGTASDPYLISNGAELAYLAQQVNNGTNYSGKYFLQTADIILNQYVPGLSSVQESESVDVDEDSAVKQEIDEQEDDGESGTGDEEDGNALSEDKNTGGDETASQNDEGEKATWVPRAVSSVVVVPEGEAIDSDDKTEIESNDEGNSDIDVDLNKVEDGTGLEVESSSATSNEENDEKQQIYSLRTSDEPLAWTPIGYSSSRSFHGTYDGDGFAISGVYINTADDYQGIFGYAGGTAQNIRITDSSITGGNYVGGIAGFIGKAENCVNTGSVSGKTSYTGGIAGSVISDVTGCINYGVVRGEAYTGGIAGRIGSNALNNENYGSVEGTEKVGGIAGETYTVSYRLEDCLNEGAVRGRTQVGGIAGYLERGRAERCRNYGDVEASAGSAGGIAGATNSWSGTMQECENHGDITAVKGAGGIVGAAGKAALNIEESTSSGTIRAESHAGGIVGSGENATGLISDCVNEGELVSGGTGIGGISGYAGISIQDSSSSARIEATGSYAGGIAGRAGNISRSMSEVSVKGGSYTGGIAGYVTDAVGCINYGTVRGEAYTGGIAGRIGSNALNNENYGSVEGTEKVGGIAGETYTVTYRLEDCLNEGSVRGRTQVGGIAGYLERGSAERCRNYGDVEASAGSAGGIAGATNSWDGTMQNCENHGDITAVKGAGGIVGAAGKAKLNIEESTSSGTIRAESHAGGIVGSGENATGMISDSTTEGLVSGDSGVGGISGYTGISIQDSSSSARIEASGSYAGSIAGRAGALIRLKNERDFEWSGSYSGGIAGYAASATDCVNTGSVSGKTSYTGGIAGSVISDVTGCINYGVVRGEAYTGGIAGRIGSNALNNENYGSVEGTEKVGGIAGETYTVSYRLEDCLNEGAVRGRTQVGGIAGYLERGRAERCRNYGDVEASAGSAGGIAGATNYWDGTMQNCENHGDITAVKGAGGIVGAAGKAKLNIEESTSSGTIRAESHAGGIVGSGENATGLISDCVNEGDLVAGDSGIGGIAGYTGMSIQDSSSSAQIEASGSYAGGIAGRAGNISRSMSEVSVKGGSYTGGIAGYVTDAVGCINYGTVRGEAYTGGIAGRIGSNALNNENYGSVEGTEKVGGIAGETYTVTYRLEDCLNEGSVRGRTQVGGIAGYLERGSAERCRNYGDVEASAGSAGGIAGATNYWDGTMQNCENHGDITAVKGAGGIVGAAGKAKLNIEESTSSGTIRAESHAGGIVGSGENATGLISGCTNTGNAVHSGGNYAGGIAGYTGGFIESCSSIATVRAEGSYAGGLVGYTTKDLAGYANYADVHAGESYAGGIAGYTSGIAENCENHGTITGGSYIGGIAGYTKGITAGVNSGSVVKGSGDYVGGLAGYAVGSITDSSSSASVEGKNRVGGIAGELYNGKVISTENTGSQVTGTEDYVGGIAGSIRGTSEVSDSINQALVSGRDHTGGIAGGTPDSSGKNAVITDSSTEGSVSGRDRVGGIAGSFQGTISSSQVSGSIAGVNYLGGIAGDSSGIIQECTNETILSGGDYVGGIAGRAGSVSMSSNEASVSGGNYIGGIAGTATGVITGSQNKAQINGSGDYTGGIAGYTTKELISSRSEGEIIGHNYVGGIAGYAGKITDYTNEADVTGTGVRVGGIAGQVNILEKCLNKGTVTGGTEAAGGLAGTVTGSVTDGYNYGRVSSSGIKVGGIVGEHTGSTLDNCVNLETVSGESYVGGVAGWSSGTINSSWNTASVRALSGVVGGIAGYSSRTINDSHNKGSVTGSGLSAGGIAGYQSGTVTISRNMGTVSGVEAVGGVVGFKQSGTVDRSLNTGLIIYSELDAGGVAGKINGSTIVDCYNLGQITGRGDQAGGIVGGSYGSGQIRNTYNTGRVSADTYRGGIIGYDNYRNPVMKNNYYVIGTAARGIGSSEEDDDHDLSELFMRVSSSELQGMAFWLGSSYQNDNLNVNQGYPILRDVNYDDLNIPSNGQFGLHTLGRGDISIQVSEKLNPSSAKEGASVELSGFESDETNEQGLALFHDPAPTSGIDRKALTVQLDGYRLYYGGIDIIRDQNAAALYDTNQFLAMLTPLKADDSTKPYVSTLMHYSREDSTKDAMTSAVSVLQDTQTELCMFAVWNGKQPQKYTLFQKSGGRLESSNGIFNENLSDTFVQGETIYAQVEASDGTKSDVEETNLQVLNIKVPAFVDFLRGTEIKLPVEKIPFLQGKLTPEFVKIPIQVKIDDTKIKVAVGVTGKKDFLNAKEWEEWSKNWKDTVYNDRQKTALQNSKWMNALTVSLKGAGYGEARFSDMNYSVLHELEIGIMLELKGELSHTAVRPIGYVPVYVKLTGGVDAKVEYYNSFDLTLEEVPLMGIDGEVVIKGMGELGVGIPRVVTAGVEGKLSFPVEFAAGRPKRIYGKGALTFKADVLGFTYDKIIGSPVELIEIFPEPGLFPDRLMLDTAALYDTAQYKPTSLDYTLNGSQWFGGGLQAEAVALAAGLITPASTVITGETLLQTNINQDSKPQIVAVGDTYAAVWIVNNAERGGSHPNWTMLVYSVYDPASGTWSEPVPVDDDGTADFNPSLKAGGGRLYVAWQNANQVFEEEDLTLEAFIAASEIAAAEFDPVSRKFGPARRITENNSLDMTPALAVSNQGTASVVWLTNSENDIFGMTGSTAVMAYDFAGGETNVLKDGLGPVSSLDAAYVNGTLTAAYSLDRDGDLSTLEDQEIYMVTAGAEPVRLTNNDVIDSNPTFGKYKDQNALFFYSEGKLLARLENGDIETIFEEEAEEAWVMDEDGELYVPETGLLTDDFQVMTSANGHTAVIWTKIQDDESRQIEGILYNKDSGQWSREIKISDSQADVMHPSGIILPDGTMKILYSRYTPGAEWGDYGQSDLCLMDLAPSYDLAVEGVYYDSSDLVPGSEIEISVLVKNNGYLPVEQIRLRIGAQETVHEVYLLPGESGAVQALYQLPGTIDLETLALQVSVPGESDITPLDNLAEITWGHADASLQLQELVNAHGQVASIKVSNHSYKDARGELVIRINGIDGQIYEVIDLGTLTNDAVKVLSYGITDEIRRIPGIESLYFIVETDQEELYESNNYDYININWYR